MTAHVPRMTVKNSFKVRTTRSHARGYHVLGGHFLQAMALLHDTHCIGDTSASTYYFGVPSIPSPNYYVHAREQMHTSDS